MRNFLMVTIFALSVNAMAQIPTDGLVGYYPFNNNANDESGNGHISIVYGAIPAPDRFGYENSAYSFDGLDDYIETNISTGFTNQITISAWIKTNQFFVDYDPGIVAQRSSTYNVTRIGVTNQNKADFLIDVIGSGSANVVCPVALNDNNWHLVVGTYDGSSLKIYFDNVLHSSLQVTSSLEMSSSFRIGNDDEPSPPARFFNGYIDDVRIYSSALESSEVELLYNEESCFHTITNQPQDQTMFVCSQANFNILTTGSSTLTYQWYKNGNEISGANSSSYVTPSLTLADNGSTYYCVITFCQGAFQETSNTATLSVLAPCTFEMPAITLDMAALVPGDVLTISGSMFTPLAQASILIENSIGQIIFEDNVDAVSNTGSFNYSLEIGIDFTEGEYTITAIDLATDNYTQGRTFSVENESFTPLQILAPKEQQTIVSGSLFDVRWSDFVSTGVPNGITGEVNKCYSVEISSNNGASWNYLQTRCVTLEKFKSHIIDYSYSINNIGVYMFRISEVGNLANTGTTDEFNVVGCPEAGFTTRLLWDESTVPNSVETSKPFPMGVAADGASRIFIHLRKKDNPKTVSSIEAEIQSLSGNYTGPAKLGKLMYDEIHTSEYCEEANATNSTESMVTIDNSEYWFWYVAPDDFADDIINESSERSVNVVFTITYTDNTSEIISLCEPITIVRPALMFVHGLYGDISSFEGAKFIRNNGNAIDFEAVHIWKVIKRVDLKEWDSFQTNGEILLGIGLDEKQTYENSIRTTLEAMHLQGFANIRLDYVAHSMGGAIGRTVINYFHEAYSPGRHILRNYSKGFINKYISICTPHNGSHWADFALDLSEEIIEGPYGKLYTIGSRLISDTEIDDILSFGDGAVSDLQVFSVGVKFGETAVRNHLISADVDEFNNLTESTLLKNKKLLNILPVSTIKYLPGGVHNFFLVDYGTSEFLSQSDIVVPLSSQLANIDESGAHDISNFGAYGISSTSIIYGKDMWHMGIQRNVTIGTRIKVLLNAGITSAYFAESIPANETTNEFMGGEEPVQRRSAVCPDSATLNFDTMVVTILNPAMNSVLNVDSVVLIQVHLQDTAGFQSLQIFTNGESYFSTSTDSIQQFEIRVGSGHLGIQYFLAVATYDSIGCLVYYGDTVVVNVGTNEVLTDFSISPKVAFLNPQEKFMPEFNLVFSSFIGQLSFPDTSINCIIQDTNVVQYDTLNQTFIAQDTGRTYLVFNYQGFNDTTYIYISTKIKDNILSLCSNDDILVISEIIDTSRMYQWQVDTSTGFFDLVNGDHYIGVDSGVLQIINPPSDWYDYRYRCVVFDTIGSTYSKIYTLRFEAIWEGDLDNAWENPGNWNCNEVPNENTEVKIPSNLIIYPIVNSNAFCRTLTIAPAATITVNTGYILNVVSP